MKQYRSVIIALSAILLIGLWFLVNAGKHKDQESAENGSLPVAVEADQKITVITEPRTASDHQITYTLYGRTEANREVAVKAKHSAAYLMLVSFGCAKKNDVTVGESSSLLIS